MSEEGVSRVIKNQRNAQQKTYHHNLGSGGYPTAIKKWNKMEADLLAKGITPNHSSGESAQRIGFSLMGEHWTRRQGSAFMAQDCKKQQKDCFMLRELLLVVRLGPTERKMS